MNTLIITHHLISHPPTELIDIGIWNAFFCLLGALGFVLFSMVGRKHDPMVEFTVKDYFAQKIAGILWGIFAGQMSLLFIQAYYPPVTLVKSTMVGFSAGSIIIILYPFIQLQLINRVKKMLGIIVIQQEQVNIKTETTVTATPDHPIVVKSELNNNN